MTVLAMNAADRDTGSEIRLGHKVASTNAQPGSTPLYDHHGNEVSGLGIERRNRGQTGSASLAFAVLTDDLQQEVVMWISMPGVLPERLAVSGADLSPPMRRPLGLSVEVFVDSVLSQ